MIKFQDFRRIFELVRCLEYDLWICVSVAAHRYPAGSESTAQLFVRTRIRTTDTSPIVHNSREVGQGRRCLLSLKVQGASTVGISEILRHLSSIIETLKKNFFNLTYDHSPIEAGSGSRPRRRSATWCVPIAIRKYIIRNSQIQTIGGTRRPGIARPFLIKNLKPNLPARSFSTDPSESGDAAYAVLSPQSDEFAHA